MALAPFFDECSREENLLSEQCVYEGDSEPTLVEQCDFLAAALAHLERMTA